MGLPGHLEPSGETGERGNGTDDGTRPDEEVHGTGGGGTAEDREELKRRVSRAWSKLGYATAPGYELDLTAELEVPRKRGSNGRGGGPPSEGEKSVPPEDVEALFAHSLRRWQSVLGLDKGPHGLRLQRTGHHVAGPGRRRARGSRGRTGTNGWRG